MESEECCFKAQADAGWMYDGPSRPPVDQCRGHHGHSDTALWGEVLLTQRFPDESVCCEISGFQGVGYTFTKDSTNPHSLGNCTIFKTVTGTIKQPGSVSGQNPPAGGNCTIFSKVTGSKSSSGKISGTNGGGAVQLWPSWPASSPWVTSVGATRFVGQKAGNEEMATDQFGSGGGFQPNLTRRSKVAEHCYQEYLKLCGRSQKASF